MCLQVKFTGKPDAGNPHVRFDEGEGSALPTLHYDNDNEFGLYGTTIWIPANGMELMQQLKRKTCKTIRLPMKPIGITITLTTDTRHLRAGA